MKWEGGRKRGAVEDRRTLESKILQGRYHYVKERSGVSDIVKEIHKQRATSPNSDQPMRGRKP